MKRQLSFREYRRIDLALFALMLVIFEFLIVRVARSALFRDQAFTVSLAAAVVSIVYMRWGVWGGLHAALAGFLFCLYSGGGGRQYAAYILGNLCSLPAALLLRRLGSERVRTGEWLSMMFPLLVLALMQGGRALVSLALGAPASGVLGFFTTDALSGLFTLVVIWIARRLDGVYEDQRHYLLRINNPTKRGENG